jgi:hypothetical protein
VSRQPAERRRISKLCSSRLPISAGVNAVARLPRRCGRARSVDRAVVLVQAYPRGVGSGGC